MEIRILAIDPGEVTGWVYFMSRDGRCEVIESGLSPNYSISERLHEIMRLQVDHMVVEKPPQQGNSRELLVLYGELMAWAGEIGFYLDTKTLFTPYPAVWKPWAQHLKLFVPKEFRDGRDLRHCRDAYQMGQWFLASHYHIKPMLQLSKREYEARKRRWAQ